MGPRFEGHRDATHPQRPRSKSLTGSCIKCCIIFANKLLLQTPACSAAVAAAAVAAAAVAAAAVAAAAVAAAAVADMYFAADAGPCSQRPALCMHAIGHACAMTCRHFEF